MMSTESRCNGEFVQISSPPGDLVSDLKRYLYDQGINPHGSSHYIMWNGHVLLDSRRLERFRESPWR